MSLTHVIAYSWTNGGTPVTGTVTSTGEAELNLEATVPGSGNVVIAADVDVSALESLMVTCDGTITLATNDDGTPDDTFTITANVPMVWTADCGLPNPFASTVDVTSFKATKGTATDATLKIKILLGDVTT